MRRQKNGLATGGALLAMSVLATAMGAETNGRTSVLVLAPFATATPAQPESVRKAYYRCNA
jgi:hypothetical protein